ncbi:flagellar motor protein MotB [Acidocella aromatica]|uniref:Chemotaxis protein MotB n=1 Tax=Acidocella aromatica TaxID=1303579 RepID=A0A840VQ70_9PROT|nr:flagellar motor protein MotB [Acidocella aromatica]MBB5373751.1 chemotaxis protein MotB [Acidocella aromatica]
MATLPKKKPKPHKPENHERWVISYADLLTLLLATFVVLYASSQHDRHKEDEVAQSFIKAFHGMPPQVMTPTPTGSRGVLQHQDSAVPKPEETPAASKLPKSMAHQLSDSMQTLQAMQLKLSALFQPMIEKHQVTVTSEPLTLIVQLDASVLFPSGEADLKPEGAALLKQVAAGFVNLPAGFRIVVQGYTDNQPIATAQFPSNWSLSAERAVTVVALFVSSGVAGKQLAAEGFGEFSPLADNGTDAGRAQNRRVVVVVHAPDPSQK